MMSSHLTLLREGHLDQVLQIFAQEEEEEEETMTKKTPLCPMRPCYQIVLGGYFCCGKKTSLDCKDGKQLKGLLPEREEELNTSITGERRCGI